MVSGYNDSFNFLGTWTVSVIFPGDIEHIIWRTKLLSRSETPGEPAGQPERGKITGLGQPWAPQLPAWNYILWDPANHQGEADLGAGEKSQSSLTQRAASHLLASSHEVFLILGIKGLCSVTLSSPCFSLPPAATHT